MRLTSGKYTGTILFTPKGYDMRPTLARTRQAVFNMIRPYILDACIIDCFAGTGAFGFEALGNGAQKAYFIESKHTDIIQKNSAKLRILPEKFEIFGMDYKKGIELAASKNIKCDIFFADPPYNRGLITKLLKILKISDILSINSIVVIEMHNDEKEDGIFEGFNIIKEKKYGDTCIILLKNQED